MHVEIEVALNFIISYLYNKLPRRRVNIFGEELEKALKHKFQGHWYPDKPVKGSAFRCFKTGDTPDPVLEIAAVQSGVLSSDILENLPHELSVWIDPGEVSYRVGEKGVIKILYSASNAPVIPIHDDYCNVVAAAIEQEVSRAFNPEAQCFKPMESLNAAFGNMAMTAPMDNGKFKGQQHQHQQQVNMMGPGSDSGEDRNSNSDNSEDNCSDNSRHNNNQMNDGYMGESSQQQNSSSTFLHRQAPPSTFTIASFAATKFGSTKLKTSSKRNNRQFSSRMSPVEFSNYIKQRTSMNQPPFMQSPNAMMGHSLKPLMSPSRSISPATAHTAPALSINSDPFYFHNNGYYGHQQQPPIQPYLGSHTQLGYGSSAALTGSTMVASSPSANAISSSISSISSASSSSASSSVSSSSLGDHLLFGGQFGLNANNRSPGQMYNFYPSAEAPFMDNGFFAPTTLPNQFEDSDLVEGNPTKFGVIGGGLSGQVGAIGQQEQMGTGQNGSSNDSNNNNGDDTSGDRSPNPNSSSSLENLQSNTFYSGSSGSPFPQLLVAN